MSPRHPVPGWQAVPASPAPLWYRDAAMDRNGTRDVIAVEGVSKIYRVFASPGERLKSRLGLRGRWVDHAALHEVTLGVRRGEALGVVGENGAGKSTLLKIVAGTTAPTTGTVRVDGTVAAILELGAAFHPEFSGRENAVLYGALMGLDRREIHDRLDEILAFAELGEFIDHPIKTYSTGMAMRLAFAVATSVEPDVLIVDEALAVGDGYFQKKCIDQILRIRERGATILFCSHAMYYVTMFCERAVWLDGGRVRRVGPADEVVEAYEAHLLARGKRTPDETGRVPGGGRAAGGTVGLRTGRVAEVHLTGREGGGVELRPHDPFTVDLVVESVRPEEPYHLMVTLDAADGRCVLAASTFWDGRDPLRGAGRYGVRLSVPDLPLAGGQYTLYVFLLDETGLHVHDEVVMTGAVTVRGDRRTGSLLDLPHGWEVS